MKTSLSFLLGILFLFTTILFIKFGIESFSNSNQLYKGLTNSDLYDFQFTLILNSVLLFILAILSFTLSINSFQVFYKYYDKYVKDKRDRDIYKQINEAKYEQLYKDLSATNILDQKKDIVEKFYAEPKSSKIEDFLDLLRDVNINMKSKPFSQRAVDMLRKAEQSNSNNN